MDTIKDTTKAPVPTFKTITMIGYHDTTVKIIATTTVLVPLSTTMTTIDNTVPEPSTITETNKTVPSPLLSAGQDTTTIIEPGLEMTTKTTAQVP